MKIKIVALCGYKGTGKSTLAENLVGQAKVPLVPNFAMNQHTGLNIRKRIFSFADGIKLSLMPTVMAAANIEMRDTNLQLDSTIELLSYDTESLKYELFYGSLKTHPLAALNNVSVRQLMQNYGTGFVRQHNEKFWQQATFNSILMYHPPNVPGFETVFAIIDDLREPHEFAGMVADCAEFSNERTQLEFVPVGVYRDGIGLADTHSSETVIETTLSMIPSDNTVNLSDATKDPVEQLYKIMGV